MMDDFLVIVLVVVFVAWLQSRPVECDPRATICTIIDQPYP